MKYFGTDGFRGEANVVLTADHAYKIGRFLGWYYNRKHKGRIVIGKDTRRSSYMYEYALCAGITASGSDAFLLHVTTTPSVAYVVRTEDFDCGVMVSASHNPYHDNGIKVIDGSGHKISADIENMMEAYIDGVFGWKEFEVSSEADDHGETVNNVDPGAMGKKASVGNVDAIDDDPDTRCEELSDLPLASGEAVGTCTDYAIGRNRYVGFLISLATRSYKGKRIGLDCSNGSSHQIAKSVFDALGAKTYVIANEPDGLNINRDCGSTHIENLQRLVKEQKLDAGFAFDGDADRCLAVDENGNIVDGDKIIYICGKYLKKYGRLEGNHVVVTVMSNLGLFKAMEKEGIECDVTAVGDKYVSEDMEKYGYVLGGEQSGHIIFSKHATTGDGILTAIMLMEVIMEEKSSLAALSDGLKVYPQLLKNLRVESKAAVMTNEEVLAERDAIEAELAGDGRILLRESGTEPLIRVMVEAGSDELCEKYVDRMIQKIRDLGLAE